MICAQTCSAFVARESRRAFGAPPAAGHSAPPAPTSPSAEPELPVRLLHHPRKRHRNRLRQGHGNRGFETKVGHTVADQCL
jgi:hypothetical protein